MLPFAVILDLKTTEYAMAFLLLGGLGRFGRLGGRLTSLAGGGRLNATHTAVVIFFLCLWLGPLSLM